jgi:hypothetical protein
MIRWASSSRCSLVVGVAMVVPFGWLVVLTLVFSFGDSQLSLVGLINWDLLVSATAVRAGDESPTVFDVEDFKVVSDCGVATV